MNLDKKISLATAILEAAHAYKDGLVPLGGIVNRIEGLLSELDEPLLSDKLFSARIALEEVYAQIRNAGFNFEQFGQPVVLRSLIEISEIMQKYLSLLQNSEQKTID
jgi:hypothetical protein